MLVELSMVEQRYEAVREVLDTGANITDVATRYGVDRRTLHRWLLRYANEGHRCNSPKGTDRRQRWFFSRRAAVSRRGGVVMLKVIRGKSFY